MTFSISGRCRRTGQFGIAISTSSICVSARCVWLRAGAGAVATQNITNPALGHVGLGLLEKGLDSAAVIDQLLKEDGKNIRYRQLAAIGRAGPPAAYSGAGCLGTHAEAFGADSVAIGNLLSNPDVPSSMVHTFEAHPDLPLAERLMRSLEEALVAGGEAGPVKSAGLHVVDKHLWRICDLRVDWDERPVSRLRETWGVFEPQMDSYVIRAVDPDRAPSYGVPGDR